MKRNDMYSGRIPELRNVFSNICINGAFPTYEIVNRNVFLTESWVGKEFVSKTNRHLNEAR